MKKIFCIIIATIFMYPIYAQNSDTYIENELIVWLEQGVDATKFAANSNEGIVPKRLLSKRLNIWLFEITAGIEQRGMKMSNLSKNANIKHIQNNHTNITLRAITPNDTHYNQQWAPAKIRLPDVWGGFTTGGTTSTSDNIVVAVIDGGFDINHEDLSFWKNTYDTPNNGIDDDNNGYVDDYHGWNAYQHTGNIVDDNHGTHVAGIAGAIGDNNRGVSGVNWNVKILPVCGNSGNEATVVEAYAYVLEMRATYNETNGQRGAFIVATNSSFGVDMGNPNNYPIWCSMYNALGNVGILSCAATANANWNIDQVGDVPTACSSEFLIAVTNTTSADVKYSNAGYGTNTIDIGAPGTNIYSTLPNNNYGNLTGTSMATPQVAGVIALMYATMPPSMIQAYKSNPANFALSIKQHLLNGADRIPSLNGLVASGRLNAFAAVIKALGITISGPTNVCPSSSINFTVSNAPIGYTWGSSSNLTPVLGSSGVFNTSSATGNGWVSIKLGSTELIRKNIKVGNGANISGPNYINTATTTSYSADPICSGLNYKWTLYKHSYNLSAGEYPESTSGKSSINIRSTHMLPTDPPSINPYILELRINDVGVATKDIDALRYGYKLNIGGIKLPNDPFAPLMFPNPASGTLRVEMNNAAAMRQAQLFSLSNNTYHVQLVSILTGAVALDQVVSSDSFDLDVSSVPNGSYAVVVSQSGSVVWSSNVVVQH